MSPPRLTDEQWHRIRQTIEAGGGTIILEWWSRRGIDLAVERALATPAKREAYEDAVILTEDAERSAQNLLIALKGLRQHPFQLMKLLGLPARGHIATMEAALDEELMKLRKPLLRLLDFAEPDEDRRRLRTRPPGTRGRDIDPVLDTMARTLMQELRRRSGMPLVDDKGRSSSFVIAIFAELIGIARWGNRANPRQTAERIVRRLLKSVKTWPEPVTPPPHWFESQPSDGPKSPVLN